MTTSSGDSHDREPVFRPKVSRLYLRGYSVQRMSRYLQLPETVISGHLADIFDEWTGEYGSLEIGECLASYGAVEEFARRRAEGAGLSVHERWGCESVALDAFTREERLRARLGRQQQSSESRLLTGTEIMKKIELTKRALSEEDNPPVSKPTDALDDEQRLIERLLVRGKSPAAIQRKLGLAPSTIAEGIDALRTHWIATYGNLENGAAMARYRDLAERALDSAVNAVVPRDQSRSLRMVLVSRDRQSVLLDQLGWLDIAREERLDLWPTPEELAQIRAEWNEPLFDPHEPSLQLPARIPPELRAELEADLEATLKLTKGSMWLDTSSEEEEEAL